MDGLSSDLHVCVCLRVSLLQNVYCEMLIVSFLAHHEDAVKMCAFIGRDGCGREPFVLLSVSYAKMVTVRQVGVNVDLSGQKQMLALTFSLIT